MELNINIDLDNAAFEDNQNELQFILRGLADLVMEGNLSTTVKWIVDSNGNRVGTIKFTNREGE